MYPHYHPADIILRGLSYSRNHPLIRPAEIIVFQKTFQSQDFHDLLLYIYQKTAFYPSFEHPLQSRHHSVQQSPLNPAQTADRKNPVLSKLHLLPEHPIPNIYKSLTISFIIQDIPLKSIPLLKFLQHNRHFPKSPNGMKKTQTNPSRRHKDASCHLYHGAPASGQKRCCIGSSLTMLASAHKIRQKEGYHIWQLPILMYA